MRLNSVVIQNFMSFGQVALDLSQTGLHLVLGINKDSEQFDSNGSGKSGLFDAIIWCLYGSVLRDVPIDDLIHTGESSCTVSVRLDVDGDDVNIVRTRTSGKKSTLEVFDGSGKELFPANSITDKQNNINDMLGLDFKTFTNSVYFGKGLSQFFMVADDETRKNILEAILQLVDFETAHKKVKDKFREVKDASYYLNQKLEIVERDIDLKHKSYELQHRSYTEQQEKATPEIAELNEQLLELDKKELLYLTKLSEIKTKIDAATDKYTRVKTAIDSEISLENEIVNNSCSKKLAAADGAYTRDVEKLTKLYNETVDTLSNTELVLNIEQDESTLLGETLLSEKFTLKHKIDAIDKKLQKFEQFEAGMLCDQCEAPITEKHRVEVISSLDLEIRDLRVIYEDADRRFREHFEKDKRRTRELQEVLKLKEEAALKFNNDKVAKLAVKQEIINKIEVSKHTDFANIRERYANRLNQEFNAYTTLVSTLKDSGATLKAESDQIVSKRLLLKTTISAIENGLKQTLTLLENLYLELGNLEVEQKDAKKKLKLYTKELEVLSFWVEAFSQKGISSFIFETTLPELSSRANYYSTILTGGSISINILPTTLVKSTGASKEKLNVVVSNSLGATSYEGCSEGEKRRVDLCLLLALQDLVSSRGTKTWDTAFFDEVFDTLDNTGISAVIDLLRTESPQKSIYLISHNNDLKNFFDSAIVVKKENGISTLEV